MLMPRVFARDVFDEFFDPRHYGHNLDLMKSDVRETEKGYELVVDIPGVKKENLKVELKEGYLTIHAETQQNEDKKDAEGRYIRRERYSGTFSRSFYVGEDVTQEEIKARFENGTLILQIPKKEQAKQPDGKKYITIEG